MKPARRGRLVAMATVLTTVLLQSAQPAGAPATDTDQQLQAFLLRLEDIFRDADPSAYIDLVAGTASGVRARDFMATELRPGATRIVIHERERQQFRDLPAGRAFRLTLDAFL